MVTLMPLLVTPLAPTCTPAESSDTVQFTPLCVIENAVPTMVATVKLFSVLAVALAGTLTYTVSLVLPLEGDAATPGASPVTDQAGQPVAETVTPTGIVVAAAGMLTAEGLIE